MRLQNPSVSDSDLTVYLTAASREVREGNYCKDDYDAQILDTCCHLLAIDNKFPEISSISSAGVDTSFAPNDPERYRQRIASRRAASWVGG
jgi:hypothetical protein